MEDENLKSLEPEEIIRLVATTGYTDASAMLRAQQLLGMAQDKLFAKAAKEIKGKFEKEMKERVARANKWGTHHVDEKAVKDIIAKVLIENCIYPYPQLLEELYKNPFGKGTPAEPTRESMQTDALGRKADFEEEHGIPSGDPEKGSDDGGQWISNPEYLKLIAEIRDAVVQLDEGENMPSSLKTEDVLMEIGQRDERFEKILGHVPTEEERIMISDDVDEDYRQHMQETMSAAASTIKAEEEGGEEFDERDPKYLAESFVNGNIGHVKEIINQGEHGEPVELAMKVMKELMDNYSPDEANSFLNVLVK